MNMKCPLCGTDKFYLDVENQKVTCSSCCFYFEMKALVRVEQERETQGESEIVSVSEVQKVTEPSHDDDFVIVGGVLTAYKGESVDVVVPDGVLEIGVQAFKEMTQIRSVHLPESLKVIRREAFWGCTNLKSINIPRSVEMFEYSIINYHYQDADGRWCVNKSEKPRCFWGCVNLTDIVHDWAYLFLHTFQGTAYVENRKALISQGKCPQCEGKISNIWQKCDNCKINWKLRPTKQWGVTELALYSDYNLQGDYWE